MKARKRRTCSTCPGRPNPTWANGSSSVDRSEEVEVAIARITRCFITAGPRPNAACANRERQDTALRAGGICRILVQPHLSEL